jgi:hypothetical protein
MLSNRAAIQSVFGVAVLVVGALAFWLPQGQSRAVQAQVMAAADFLVQRLDGDGHFHVEAYDRRLKSIGQWPLEAGADTLALARDGRRVLALSRAKAVHFEAGQPSSLQALDLVGVDPQAGVCYAVNGSRFVAIASMKSERNPSTDRIETQGQLEVFDLTRRAPPTCLPLGRSVWVERRVHEDERAVFWLGRVVEAGPSYGLGILYALDKATGRLGSPRYFSRSLGSPTAIAGDGRRLFLASIYTSPGARANDGQDLSTNIEVLDQASFGPLGRIECGDVLVRSLFVNQERRVLVVVGTRRPLGTSRAVVCLFDLVSLAPKRQFELSFPMRDVAMSRSGLLLFSHAAGRECQEGLAIYDPSTGHQVGHVAGHFSALSR